MRRRAGVADLRRNDGMDDGAVRHSATAPALPPRTVRGARSRQGTRTATAERRECGHRSATGSQVTRLTRGTSTLDQLTGEVWFGVMTGLSASGFYVFLAVWSGGRIWSRTKERLAVQETLRRLVDSGTALTPEVIDALRRPTPKRSPEEISASVMRYRYWGLFL